MTNKLSQDELDLWKQATAICASLAGTSYSDSVELVNSMALKPALHNKVISILDKQSVKTQVFEKVSGRPLISDQQNNNLLIGTFIDEYRIKKLIAQGGMSSVYLAEYNKEGFKKDVAIKLLSPYYTSQKSVELFNREQHILSKLNHSNIVSFHHSGQTHDGTHYLVMEYITNASEITQYCQAQNLNHNAIVELIIKLAKIFSYTHKKQIIHRDIKPSNILINSIGEPIVIDFGIGRFDMFNNKTSTQVFTLEAASPEQILGLDITTQTDIFSLGALLLELITGKKTLPDTTLKSYTCTHHQSHINKLLKSAHIDHDLSNVIKKAMHFDVSHRYQYMTEFYADLINWTNNKPVSAVKDSIIYRSQKFCERNKFAVSFAAVFIAVTLFTSLFLYVSINERISIEKQKQNSLALVNAMFDQIDPLKSKGIGKREEITRYFENLTTKNKALLESDPEIEYLYNNRLLSIYQNQGKFNEALEKNRSARTALLKFSDVNDDRYITLKTQSFHLLESMGQFEQALSLGLSYQKKLEQMDELPAENILNLYYLFNKIYSYEGRLDKALDIVDKAEFLIKNHPEISHKVQASMYNSIAVVRRQNGQPERAIKNYLKAIELFKAIPDSELSLAAVYSNLAIIYGRSKHYSESEDYFQQSINLYQSIDSSHLALAGTYLSLSTLYKVLGQYNKASQTIVKSLEIYQMYDDKIRMGDSYYKLTLLELTKNNPSKAMHYALSGYENYLSDESSINPQFINMVYASFWVMLFDDFKDQSHILAGILETKLPDSKHLSTYQRFQFQLALLSSDDIALNSTQQTLINYLNLPATVSKEDKLSWLKPQLKSIDDKDSIIYIWLALEQLALEPNALKLNEYCDTNNAWKKSSWLYPKYIITAACLRFKQDLNPDYAAELMRLKTSIDRDLKQNKTQIQKIINDMIHLTHQHPRLHQRN